MRTPKFHFGDDASIKRAKEWAEKLQLLKKIWNNAVPRDIDGTCLFCSHVIKANAPHMEAGVLRAHAECLSETRDLAIRSGMRLKQ